MEKVHRVGSERTKARCDKHGEVCQASNCCQQQEPASVQTAQLSKWFLAQQKSMRLAHSHHVISFVTTHGTRPGAKCPSHMRVPVCGFPQSLIVFAGCVVGEINLLRRDDKRRKQRRDDVTTCVNNTYLFAASISNQDVHRPVPQRNTILNQSSDPLVHLLHRHDDRQAGVCCKRT
jgi:hypothetical protein